MLAVFGLAMLMLVFIRDLGSSLMYFGAFLALVYVATNRLSFVLVGLALFALGAWFMASHVPHIQDRVDIWLDPFKTYASSGYQIANGVFAQADGGLFGTGLGASVLKLPGGAPLIPAPETDMIYAVIVNDLGLLGGAGVIATYLLIAERGFKIATLASDSFSKLLATGLTAVMALQVFVIVGGVTRVIPLTGVTLPFVSYGGSSIVANFVLLALLLLFLVLVAFSSRWAVFGATRLNQNPHNSRVILEQQRVKRGIIRADDGTALARNHVLSGGRYGRFYPFGRLMALPVGFNSVRFGRAGLEKSYDDQLTGRKTELADVLDSLLKKRT